MKTDGSKLQDNNGIDVYSELFSQGAPVEYYMSNFDTDIFVISSASENHRSNINCVSKAVILVDFKATIQAVTINHCIETRIISNMKQVLNCFRNHIKTIVLKIN